VHDELVLEVEKGLEDEIGVDHEVRKVWGKHKAPRQRQLSLPTIPFGIGPS
jgi:hypothetical protein